MDPIFVGLLFACIGAFPGLSSPGNGGGLRLQKGSISHCQPRRDTLWVFPKFLVITCRIIRARQVQVFNTPSRQT